jgi:hypothetical protein
MNKTNREPVSPSAVPATASAPAKEARPAFERPRVRRLGALPAVTTAFGGSFTP